MPQLTAVPRTGGFGPSGTCPESAGLLNVAMKRAGALEFIPAVLAVILFASPWAFGFTAVTALAWSEWIIAILVVLAVGSLVTMLNRRAMA